MSLAFRLIVPRDEQLPQRERWCRIVTRAYLSSCCVASSASRCGSHVWARRLSQRRSAVCSAALSSIAPVACNVPAERSRIRTVVASFARQSSRQRSLVAGNAMCEGICQRSLAVIGWPDRASFFSIQRRCPSSNPGINRSSKLRGTTTTSSFEGLMVRLTCRARDDRRTRYAGRESIVAGDTLNMVDFIITAVFYGMRAGLVKRNVAWI